MTTSTLPVTSTHFQATQSLQFYIGATLSLEGELNAERARSKTMQQKLEQQQEQHTAESHRFVGQNARLNQEIKILNARLERLRDVCGFD